MKILYIIIICLVILLSILIVYSSKKYNNQNNHTTTIYPHISTTAQPNPNSLPETKKIIKCTKPNYDPYSDNCNRCMNGFDINQKCEKCLKPNYDPESNCTTCINGFNIIQDCKKCLQGYAKNCIDCDKAYKKDSNGSCQPIIS